MFICPKMLDGLLDYFDGFFDAVVFVDDFEVVDTAGLGGANFLLGLGEASQDGGFVVAASFAEAFEQVFLAGGQNKNAHGVREELVDEDGSLDVDLQEDGMAPFEALDDGRFSVPYQLPNT